MDVKKKYVKKVYDYDAKRLFNYGLYKLGRQDYSRFELKQKMKRFQEKEELIEEALDRLVEKNYLSDERRARSIVNSSKNKSGNRKIKMKLMLKGIDRELVEQSLEENKVSEEESHKIIVDMLIRKYKIYERENQNKMFNFLLYRGFGFDEIKKAMDEFKNVEHAA